MSYFNGSGGFYKWGTSELVPLVPITLIYCDACAEAGHVPFEPMGHRWGKRRALTRQTGGWRWVHYYGGDATCSACGRAECWWRVGLPPQDINTGPSLEHKHAFKRAVRSAPRGPHAPAAEVRHAAGLQDRKRRIAYLRRWLAAWK